MNFVRDYYDSIKSGGEVVPQTIRVTLKRELENMERRDFPYRFDPGVGLLSIEFIEKFCKHSKGRWIGKPLTLELFQKAKLQLVFGWLDRETGLRRFRDVVDVRGRKCGKSTETAGVEHFMLLADGEGGAEIYCVANKLDQARIIFNEAANMRLQSPALARTLRKRHGDIYFPQTFSKIKALASDKSTLDGLNAHFFSLDEWHELRDRRIFDVMKQSQSAREQPLAWLISTNGFVRESFFDEMYGHAKDIALGVVREDTMLPWLYQLDSRDEWTNPECWQKANPGLGRIKSIRFLSDEIEKAKRNPSYLPSILTKDFNLPETQSESWLPFEAIVSDETADMEYLRNSYAVGGCDLSATTDLTCATLIIRKPNDPRIYVLQQYFLPEAKVEKSRCAGNTEAPYALWTEQKFITASGGAAVDFESVTAWFVDMVKVWNIRPLWIGYDRALAGYWAPDMEKHGFDLEKIAQGAFTWTYPMKNMGAAFEDHLVVYQRNPILRWCLTNTGIKSVNRSGIESIQPVKLGSTRRIDGTVSLLNAWVSYLNHFDEYMAYVK